MEKVRANKPDFLMELASEICKNRGLKYDHPKIFVRGKLQEVQLDSIDIWHVGRNEYIRLKSYEDILYVEVWDDDNCCYWDNNYEFNTLNPDTIREDCFGAMAEILKQELEFAKKIVDGTKSFLREIRYGTKDLDS